MKTEKRLKHKNEYNYVHNNIYHGLTNISDECIGYRYQNIQKGFYLHQNPHLSIDLYSFLKHYERGDYRYDGVIKPPYL